MDDFIGKLLVIILAVFMLFIGPIMIITLKQDNNIQSYVDDCTQEFVSKARSTGYISTQNYLDLLDSLDSTGILFEVHITHSKRRVEPVFDEVTGEATGDFEIHYTDYTKSDIETIIFPPDISAYTANEKYVMNNGDYIQVTVQNRTPSFGTKMMQLFNTAYEGKNILTSSGGYIGNTAQ